MLKTNWEKSCLTSAACPCPPALLYSIHEAVLFDAPECECVLKTLVPWGVVLCRLRP